MCCRFLPMGGTRHAPSTSQKHQQHKFIAWRRCSWNMGSLFLYGLELEEVASVFKIHNLWWEPLKFVLLPKKSAKERIILYQNIRVILTWMMNTTRTKTNKFDNIAYHRNSFAVISNCAAAVPEFRWYEQRGSFSEKINISGLVLLSFSDLKLGHFKLLWKNKTKQNKTVLLMRYIVFCFFYRSCSWRVLPVAFGRFWWWWRW